MPERPTSSKPMAATQPDVITDMLGKPPGWMLRWGLTVIALVLLGLLTLSWLVRYPDILPARVVLTTETPVVDLIVPIAARLDSILVADTEEVAAQDPLAILESPASFNQIVQLQQFLKDADPGVEPPSLDQLGALQPVYALYLRQLQSLELYSSAQKNSRSAEWIETQIVQLDSVGVFLDRQINLLKKETFLALEQFNRQEALEKDGVISKVELNEAEANLRAVQRQLEAARERKLANEARLRQLEQEKNLFLDDEEEVLREKRLEVAATRQELLASIVQWDQQYVLRAPASGMLTFAQPWVPQQFVAAGTRFGVLSSTVAERSLLARAYLPLRNSGKVNTGQTVNIILDGFPAPEFGVLKGTIQSIAAVPQDNQYLLEIKVPQDLRTTYQETLPFRPQMTGRAEILTANRRFLERILDQLMDAFRNR